MRDYVLSRAEAAEATGILSVLWRFFRNWRARQAVQRLDALDDSLLRDIGVTRPEVRWAAGLPLTVNAALELEERAVRRQRDEVRKPGATSRACPVCP